MKINKCSSSMIVFLQLGSSNTREDCLNTNDIKNPFSNSRYVKVNTWVVLTSTSIAP